MKTKKHARILCLLLCLAFLLASCGDNDNDTSSEETESVEQVSEYVSDIVSQSESSEESSEEPSEPDYQVEMTEEMMREYLKFQRIGNSLESILASKGLEDYDYNNDYFPIGNLNGYTLCGISVLPSFTDGYMRYFPVNYVLGDYAFSGNGNSMGYEIYYCLYNDMNFISLKNAYEDGLFDAKDAYELMQKDGRFKNCANKLSDLDYQFEMTEEMADTFLKFTKRDYKTAAEMFDNIRKAYPLAEYDYNYDYIPFGNLNGYTLCHIPSSFMSAISNPMFSCYIAGDYVFTSRGPEQYMSLVNLYLYKDMSFITFEDAYEQGMFNPEDAYKLIRQNPRFANMSKKLSDLSEDEVETYRNNHKSLVEFYKKTK